MKNAIAIKTVKLTKIFSRNIKAIDNIDLTVNQGELFCLVGSNGYGKIALIKIFGKGQDIYVCES